jgi:C-terminal processing protease CtpA/Prc
MKQGEQVRTFGAPTYGAAGETTIVDLGNDTKLHLPTQLTMDAKGTIYEGTGLTPDQAVPWAEEGDPVLAAAVAWLATQ